MNPARLLRRPAGTALALVLALVLPTETRAVPAGSDAANPAVAALVRVLVRDVLAPAYTAFAAAAAAQADQVSALCAAPDASALAGARAAFARTVTAFARVEPFRFGPAREDNRFERLFFWPDPRGRGARQVERLLAARDESATSVGRLQEKSVAVQGLPALEAALFGADSDALAGPGDGPGTAASFRCRYAAAVAAAVAQTAVALEAAWRGPAAEALLAAGPDHPDYRSHGEALQDILQAAGEQLQIDAEMKLGAVLGPGPDAALPRLAPFARSGQTLPSVLANLDGVEALLVPALEEALGPDGWLVRSARFEIGQARRVLGPLAEDPRPLAELLADPQARRRLAYARLPIEAARALLVERMADALGLVAGFNALDGD